MSRPSTYIRAVRLAQVDERGILIGDQRHDRLTLYLPDGEICTTAGLTVATHTVHHAAPVILPGWYPDAYRVGLHRGRPALVHQGLTRLQWMRGTEIQAGYTGLNAHDWRGRSDGCITAPSWWVGAVLAAIEAQGLEYVGLDLQEPRRG